MVLGKLPVPGRPTIWMIVGQGPIALAVGAGGGCLDIFTLLYPFFSFSLSLGAPSHHPTTPSLLNLVKVLEWKTYLFGRFSWKYLPVK